MWHLAFSQCPDCRWDNVHDKLSIAERGLADLKRFLDRVHVAQCLLRPYFETPDYPLVEPRELLPSFDVDLYEYRHLPGFSMVAFDRPLQSFREIFQYDVLHSLLDWNREDLVSTPCPLEERVFRGNAQTFMARLPRRTHESFEQRFKSSDICCLDRYPELLPFLLQLERAHVLARDAGGEFNLCGIWASLPSDLDSELKRFGMRIGKFSANDNLRYECNRNFVYQFLMELYGFPIASERRTSAALFARRLMRMGETFLVRVLGQSDRTITTLSSLGRDKSFPLVEKLALVQVPAELKETVQILREQGFFIDEKKRVIIFRVVYRQHKFDPKNVREDRALSVVRQEVIHPVTGRVLDHLNIIKDAGSAILTLNDIVRGEYVGRIIYKRNEIISDTESHEHRLKTLYSWLSKNQHRIIDYSDDFYSKLVRLLEGYLLSPALPDQFRHVALLHQEVCLKFSFIQQARKIKILEDLSGRQYKGRSVSYQEMLRIMTEILGELLFELVHYFDPLVEKALRIGRDVLEDPYVRRTYVQVKDERLTPYGLSVKRSYGRLVSLLDEFRSIRRVRQEPSASARHAGQSV